MGSLSIALALSAFAGGNGSGGGDLFIIQEVIPLVDQIKQIATKNPEIYAGRSDGEKKYFEHVLDHALLIRNPYGENTPENLAILRAHFDYQLQKTRNYIFIPISKFLSSTIKERLSFLHHEYCLASKLDESVCSELNSRFVREIELDEIPVPIMANDTNNFPTSNAGLSDALREAQRNLRKLMRSKSFMENESDVAGIEFVYHGLSSPRAKAARFELIRKRVERLQMVINHSKKTYFIGPLSEKFREQADASPLRDESNSVNSAYSYPDWTKKPYDAGRFGSEFRRAPRPLIGISGSEWGSATRRSQLTLITHELLVFGGTRSNGRLSSVSKVARIVRVKVLIVLQFEKVKRKAVNSFVRGVHDSTVEFDNRLQ